MIDTESILETALEKDASDIFIIAGLPLTYKVDGVQVREGDGEFSPEMTGKLVEQIYTLANRKIPFDDAGAVDDDFSFSIAHKGRFRVNVFKQRGSLAAVIRLIHFGLPHPGELNIPEAVLKVADNRKGLVLVTGPAGSGKSTTLACLVDRINSKRQGHIITMEDPIEFIHRHRKSIVTQREVTNDTTDYATSLRAALRESPDVILLGEMRDLETMDIAMTAAETGQLLISTLHTVGAANTIDRIVDVFPAEQQRQIRVQLSMVLDAVVSQQLVPDVDGKLIPVFEIMYADTAIRNLIREAKTFQIESSILAGASLGMVTMDASLLDLVEKGRITRDTALRYCVHHETFEKKLDQLA